MFDTFEERILRNNIKSAMIPAEHKQHVDKRLIFCETKE
jgi:hypothetical protein